MFLKAMKENEPDKYAKITAWFQMVGAVFVVVGAVVGGIMWMFSTFAEAADIQRIEKQQTYIIQRQEQQFDQYRKDQIETKLLELRSKRTPTQEDRALILHFESKLREVDLRLSNNPVSPVLPTR